MNGWVFIVQHSDKLHFQIAEDVPRTIRRSWATRLLSGLGHRESVLSVLLGLAVPLLQQSVSRWAFS